jgi:hypothetical protein
VSKQTPASPDYTGAANAQAASSRDVTEQQTWANRPTINTPFGQQTWEVKPTWDPTTGTYLNSWTQNTNLTPESQSALDAQMRITQGKSNIAESMLGRSQNEFGQEMNWDDFANLADTPQAQQFGKAPGIPDYNPENIQRGLDTSSLQGVDSSQKYAKNAEDAIYGQWSNRQEPRMQQELDQKRTQLYNQGLKEGDQAFDAEMQRMREDQNDARTQAQYQATIGSGQEAERMFGMDLGNRQQGFNETQAGGAFANSAAAQALQQQLGIGSQKFNQEMSGAQLGDTRQGTNFNQQLTSANYQNQMRQQQIAEQMQKRGFSLNEINSILSGQQISMPNMPSFNTANASQAAQYNNAAQNQGQYNLDAFSAQQAGINSALSGAGSAAMMFSDRRLKKGIIFLRMKDGANWYVFQYKWDPEGKIRVGVMADEIDPSLVVRHKSGYNMVDYGRLG